MVNSLAGLTVRKNVASFEESLSARQIKVLLSVTAFKYNSYPRFTSNGRSKGYIQNSRIVSFGGWPNNCGMGKRFAWVDKREKSNMVVISREYKFVACTEKYVWDQLTEESSAPCVHMNYSGCYVTRGMATGVLQINYRWEGLPGGYLVLSFTDHMSELIVN